MFLSPKTTQKAFTLVELAIVITIIGLLIGGVLKGMELMQNAKAVGTVAQIKAYETAVSAFRTKYKYYPGDMPHASDVLDNCNTNCDPVLNDGRGFSIAGDDIIGGRYPVGNALVNTPYSGPVNIPIPPFISDSESYLFWIHLLKANLITGVTDAEIHSSTPQAIGVTHPEVKMGGTFYVTYNWIDTLAGAPVATRPFGNMLVLVPTPRTPPTMQTAGQNIMKPSEAYQIDVKLDDGAPMTGSLVAYGTPATCFKNSSGNYVYDGSSASKDCSIIYILPR